MGNFIFRHISNSVPIADGIDVFRVRTLDDGSQEVAVHTGGEDFSVIEAVLIDQEEPTPDPDPDPTPDPIPDPEPSDVSSMAELMAALDSVSPGTTILMAGGNYGSLALRGDRPVVLKSADFSNPAVFSSAALTGVTGLKFDGVRFEGSNYAGGDLSGDGVFIRSSEDVVLDRCEVRAFNQGVRWLECKNVAITNSDIHTIAGDGLKVAMVDGLLIEGNHIHDFRANLGSAKHRDMLQIFTKGHDYASKNITIRDNTFDIGDGDWTQSIYARNEEVDQGSNPNMFYSNFRIEGNTIRNAQIHGISIGETNGLVIDGNNVTYVPAPTGPDHPDAPNAPVPRISVAERSLNVTITDNTAPEYRGQIQSGWTVEGNVWTG